MELSTRMPKTTRRSYLDIESYGAINLNATNYGEMYLDTENY